MTLRGGIDLGGTKVQAVVVDEANEVRGQARAQTPLRGGPPAVAATMAAALREAAQQAGADPHELAGVGRRLPGQVDDAAGTVSSAKNLTDWAGTFALAQALRDDLGVDEIRLSNDVGAAADAEARLGAARDASSFLGVFWGTGVGGAVILDGVPLAGARLRRRVRAHGHQARGRALPVRAPRPRRGLRRPRRHGGQGARAAREGREDGPLQAHGGEGPRPPDVRHLGARAAPRRPVAEHLIERGLQAIAAGAASAVNLLDVEAVVLGGGLGIRFGEPMAERLREAMLPHLFVDQRPPAVRVAELGDLGGALGASLMVAQEPSPAPAG